MTEQYREIVAKIDQAKELTKKDLRKIQKMWTAYCRSEGILVDTYQYDVELTALWVLCEDKTGDMTWEEFDNFMAEKLV